MSAFLDHLTDVAASPWAFLAYLVVLAVWAFALIARHRLNVVANLFREIPETDRQKVLLREYSTLPRSGVSAEQWIKARRQMMLLVGFLATLISALTLGLVVLTRLSDNKSTLPVLEHPTEHAPTTGESFDKPGLRVARILEGKSPDTASRLFEIVLVNTSPRQRFLTHFDVAWRYYAGKTALVAEGAALQPVAKYIVELPINVLDESWQQKQEVIYPVPVIPLGSDSAPGVLSLRLQLHYKFITASGYHPSSDWDIVFNVSITDSSEKKTPVFERKSWRESAHGSTSK